MVWNNKVSVIIVPYGKADAVTRLNPAGEKDEVCLCRYNVDFSEGCIAMVHVSRLDEVIANKGRYNPGNWKKYKAEGNASVRCDYCYAYKNIRNVAPKIVDGITEASFEAFKPKIIRIGKLTEAGHPYYYEDLMKFFDLCINYESEVIFPTKMFPFGLQGALETQEFAENHNSAVASLAKKIGMASGAQIAERLKKVGGTLMYSMGYDSKERGAVSQGFTNQWRINQATRFADYLPTSLTLVVDVHRSFKENAEAGSPILNALELRNKLNVRLLPIRPTKRDICVDLCGGTRAELLGIDKAELLTGLKDIYYTSGNGAPYHSKGNNQLVPEYFHPDFQRLVDEGIGVCGTVGETEYCDKCHRDGCSERVSFPASELIPLVYDKKSKGKWKRDKNKKSKQGRLFK